LYWFSLRQVIQELEKLFNGIKAESPMRVVEFATFEKFGKLPRSSDKKTIELDAVPSDAKLVFISHAATC
jgi:hypothetical protein